MHIGKTRAHIQREYCSRMALNICGKKLPKRTRELGVAFAGRLPFRVEFIEIYRAGCNIKDIFTFISRLGANYKPHFPDINERFRRDVLNYAAGRYLPAKGEAVGAKLSDINCWADLLNNIYTAFDVNITFISEDIAKGLKTDLDILLDIRTSYARLKIIEDWIWFHRNDPAIRSLLMKPSAALEEVDIDSLLQGQGVFLF